jgi:hypothetical protein
VKLGLLKRIPKEQLQKSGGDLPAWIDALLSPLNEFIEKVGSGLQNNLTFRDNFLGKTVEIELTSNTALEINPKNVGQSNLRVTGVLLLASGSLLVKSFGWQTKTNGNIDVTVIYESGTSAVCRLQIFLE